MPSRTPMIPGAHLLGSTARIQRDIRAERFCSCKLCCCRQGCNQLFISGGGNFHEISFDDVIVLIQPWYNFFANGHI